MTTDGDRAEALRRLQPYVERARQFSGWDFSDVAVRRLEPGPPWDYQAIVRARARDARSALDMGTGGGEVLSGLRAHLPARVVATEEWDVNVSVARRRLAPLGIDVVWCHNLRLPFADVTFDLVINRHEWLDPAEVARVLRPGGYAVTQQVGRNDWRELRRYFPRITEFGDLYGDYRRGFAAAGLRVSSLAHDHKVAYATLGDVVYLLAVMPWWLPGFDLERDLDALLALEAACRTTDGLVLTESRFLIVGEKPAGDWPAGRSPDPAPACADWEHR